ncbi:MAG: RrF2 family transcriptional regulator [Alphaproteobacteria bacterium]|jgi:Rrf2 family nitric oxide-sensitive transcriptional repressor
MILTKYADYSIRVLIYLAERPGTRVSIATIASDYDISRNHLMKVSQNLARHGYIVGYRGKGGGIMLARPARTINMGELLGDVERNLKVDEDSFETADRENIRLVLGKALEAFTDTFAAYTLADFIKENGCAPVHPEREEQEQSQGPRCA